MSLCLRLSLQVTGYHTEANTIVQASLYYVSRGFLDLKLLNILILLIWSEVAETQLNYVFLSHSTVLVNNLKPAPPPLPTTFNKSVRVSE